MKQLIYLSLIALSLSACSPTLVPFSQNMIDDFSWSDQDLERIQFYLSEDVKLYRNTSANSSKIENGAIRLKDGQKIEEITFVKGTPGVFIFSPKKDRMAVSFEDDNDKFLMFGPNPKIGNRYAILAKDWKRHIGKITYGGEDYFISNEDGLASLTVDMDKVNTTKVTSKRVKGRELK